MQDIILTAGSIVFILALVPSIRSKDKPALLTSSMTAFVLYVFACTYISLGLWLTASVTALTAAMWTALAVQKWTKASRGKNTAHEGR